MTTSLDRRAEVLARAAELFASRGISGTTVRDIGEASGMLAGSLYHHFNSKDDIVRKLLTRYMDAIHESLRSVVDADTVAPAALQGLVLQTLTLIESHPHATSIYQNDQQYLREHGLLQPVEDVSAQVRSLWMQTIEAGVADGTLRADVPSEVIYRTMRDALWGTHRWPTRADYTTEELADLMVRLFLTGSAGTASPGAQPRI